MLNILIAEDDKVSRKFLWKLLESYGNCDLVVNGMEAIDAYMMSLTDDNPYDLVCLDIMMPVIDGIKALKTIRDLEKHNEIIKPAKIVMVSALSEKEVIDDAFNKGANACATKPLNIEKFLEVMKNLNLVD